MLLNEQIRRYNEKLEEIEQLEYAEALAVNQLKLKRKNTVNLTCLDLSVVMHYLKVVCFQMPVKNAHIFPLEQSQQSATFHKAPTESNCRNTFFASLFLMSL